MDYRRLCIIVFVATHFFAISQSATRTCGLKDFSSEDILVKTSYEDMLNRYGKPISEKEASYKPRNIDSLIHIVHELYEGFSYIRYGDSVQLHFIDFNSTNYRMWLREFPLKNSTRIKSLVKYLSFEHYLGSSTQDEELFSYIEGHYCTYKKVKVVCLSNINGAPDHICICFRNSIFDKTLWYIELPIILLGGIVIV